MPGLQLQDSDEPITMDISTDTEADDGTEAENEPTEPPAPTKEETGDDGGELAPVEEETGDDVQEASADGDGGRADDGGGLLALVLTAVAGVVLYFLTDDDDGGGGETLGV